MKKLSFQKIFVENTPYQLGWVVNQLGQLVLFFEHPTLGDDYPIICLMADGNVYNTGFYDLGDFYEGSDYMPVIHNGEAKFYYEII